MTNLDKVATSNNRKFYGFWENAENATKSYHVYKVIVVLHFYNKFLGIIGAPRDFVELGRRACYFQEAGEHC